MRMNESSREPFSADYEAKRLEALRQYQILDTPPEALFDDLVDIAAYICEAPIAVINFIDGHRQWFKAVKGLGVRETKLDISICRHTILQTGTFVVPDLSRDDRFAANPLVTGESHLRFYAGALLESSDGFPLGTVCVLDTRPRELTELQQNTLQALARQAMGNLELMRTNHLQRELLNELEQTREQLVQQATTDPLTGLFNRRAFDEQLEQELAQIHRGRAPGSLMMIDLDYFKRINDEAGHHKGDRVLTRFSELCRSLFRQGDTLARWGGEEFMILLPETGTKDAEVVASRLHQQLSDDPLHEPGQQTPLTVSIGIIPLGRVDDSVQALREVDAALYLAKDRGRQCTVVLDSELSD